MPTLPLSRLFLCAAAAAQAEPAAWIRLGEAGGESYREVPYHWLADAPLRLVVELPPGDGYLLELMWGAKNDRRGAEIAVDGATRTMVAGGFDGFRWQRVDLPGGLAGGRHELALGPAGPKAAFLAGVRLGPAGALVDEPLPAAQSKRISRVGEPLEQWIEELRAAAAGPDARAAIHARQANEALRRCRRYVDGWLAHTDPVSGLIPRGLVQGRDYWNGRDAAADNYAFMVLTCALTDRAMFDGRMLGMLRAETRLTSRVGALPADYSFSRRGFRHDRPDISRLIFDGSEYVKDGLMPITEWLGPSPWSERMIAIVDSILEHAPHPTPAGAIPSDDVEVNGEMMQVLSRLRFMTGDERYLAMACRIADYYLLGGHHPTRDFARLGLRDHNCELISGLTEVYAACRHLRPGRADAYRGPLRAMLDRILEVGVNEHGLMFQEIDPRTGRVLDSTIHDNWGYNYNGIYTVHLLDGVPGYRQATRRALAALAPHYMRFPWQGWGSDGIADSVEGAINLFNREPDVEGVAGWIDANIARMLMIQRPDGVIEGWHGDGNYARTAIMWALWKQQGVTIRPWREDVMLGAVREGQRLRLVVSAASPWTGLLVFDAPRHRSVMRLPLDYPRINQFPEWFTADPGVRYRVGGIAGGPAAAQSRELPGTELLRGVEVTAGPGRGRAISVEPAGPIE